MAQPFNHQSNNRITRTVLRDEARRQSPVRDQNLALDNADNFRLGKTAAAINKGNPGTINIYLGATKGTETWDGTTTITAYNRFANIAAGKWVFCMWLLGGWEVFVAEC